MKVANLYNLFKIIYILPEEAKLPKDLSSKIDMLLHKTKLYEKNMSFCIPCHISKVANKQ